MSIAKALSNAVSGLAATSRGTETVAANIANVLTPGYARREMSLSSQSLGGLSGGVRINGVSRVVNEALLAETRLASAASSRASELAGFYNQVEEVVGLPGEPAAISTALTQFETALIAASVRPDEDLRLIRVAEAADTLADRLNQASRAIQDARSTADTSIATHVDSLNDDLAKVAKLNKRIASFGPGGADLSSLYDERQSVIDRMSEIVPLRIVPRDAGRVSVFTAEGAVLLDGLTPARLSFQPAGQFVPAMQPGTPGVSGLRYNDQELMGSGLRLFRGGALEAAFDIRDQLAPQVQAELDSLALDLYGRFADPTVDPTLAPGTPGLFTDGGAAAAAPPVMGLSGTIAPHSAIRSDNGEIWRLRAGLNAAASGAVSDGALIDRLSEALQSVREMAPPSQFRGRHDAAGFAAKLEATIASRRVSAEAEATLQETRSTNLSELLMSDGVDTDSEMQRLLQYEKAYAANARVIQAIDEMMNALLRV